MSREVAQTEPDRHAITKESARELVNKIADQHGYLGEETLSQMSPAMRRKVEYALLRKDEMIGSSVITLAKNLYNSSARFVFELLQNADDNCYTRAKLASVAPFVSFRVYREQIILECNEDGFTAENLVAICNVGQSSKASAQGYIGEKGIGFKSVFMVAWKVHIQSGNFSFSFQHKKEDSGMGMISPVWEETDDTLDGPLTRITLYLHETGTRDNLARQRAITLQQFHELQATFLLFMKNLRRIDVTIYDDDDNEPVSSSTFSMEEQSQDRVHLTKKTVVNQEIQDHTQHYHIIREIVSDLPQNENRRYTDTELEDETYATAAIVLAFPLTHDSVPIIEPQDVFAFLPVRTMGFPFLIQSDFVTDASRQDIVKSSARNATLLAAAARVFVHAVSQFCEHQTLRFQWMRYLLNDKEHSWDTFWTRFLDKIRANLKETPVLWTKSLRKLRCIEDMRRVPSTMMDHNGEPLFPDLDVEQYLAVEYLKKDLDILKTHGLSMMGNREFLARVRQDQNKEDDSIMFHPDTDDDWHSRVAKILVDCWDQDSSRMDDLALIPLGKGVWVSAETCKDDEVYFSQVAGLPIPREVKLRLVNPRAEGNPHRKQLFSLLGVEEATVRYIRSLVFTYHRSGVSATTSLSTYKSTVAFLYQTAHLDPRNDTRPHYRDIKLLDQLQNVRVAQFNAFYFPNDDPYGAQQLLQSPGPKENTGGISNLDISILHEDYMSDYPTQQEGQKMSWKTWLSEKLDVQDVIPLATDADLTKECLYVAEHHPERFIGFLLKYWKSDGGYLTDDQALVGKLLKVKVLCENGDMFPLGETYIRSPQLEYINPFLREGEFFPWLKHDASSGGRAGFDDLDTVAKALGFGYPKSELEFYLMTLRFIVDANEDAEELLDVDRVYELYGRIEARQHESPAVNRSRQMIRDAFNSHDLVYTPPYGDEAASWTGLECCLWEAPGFLGSKYPLKSLYGNMKDAEYLAKFFQTTLQVPDACIEDLLDELLYIKLQERPNTRDSYILYQQMEDMLSDLDSELAEDIQECFEDDALIYYKANTEEWHSPSECVWSSVTDLQGMVTLNDTYDNLAGFFVDFLRVRTLTLEIVYNKLVRQGKWGASTADVKKTIWQLNSFLQQSEGLPDPGPVMENKVLPVKFPDDSVELCSSSVNFAIADRKHLAHLFSGKVKLLDFGTNDIRKLEPFLHWAGLDSRYLSTSVKEISALHGDVHKSVALTDRDISQKAHGLFRIAAHFSSPRLKKGEQALHKLLEGIKVCETDGISSELHLNQDGKDVQVEVIRGELHFQETKEGLLIYVPRNKHDQYLCFLDRIPRALLEWMMTEPSTGITEPFDEIAINIISTVLQADQQYVALALDRAGIMSVETKDVSTEYDIKISSTHGNDPRTPVYSNEDNPTWDAASSTLYEASVVSADDSITTSTGNSRTS